MFISCAYIPIYAQTDHEYDDIVATFDLDSFTVIAVDQGKLDPIKFIHHTMEDTTLFHGFSLLKATPHQMLMRAQVSDKKNRIGNIRRTYIQTIINNCREQSYQTLDSSGYFFDKKGLPISETYQMMMQFFTQAQPTCNIKIPAAPKGVIVLDSPKDLRQQKEFIKRFIFAPHTLRIDVPFMGNKMKTNIFEAPTSDMYTFRVRYDWQGDSIPVYHFDIEVDSIKHPNWKKTVLIQKMHTTFKAEDLTILRRSYVLYYPGWLASCDLSIDIQMQEKDSQLLPKKIHYLGEWKFPTKGKDRADIDLQFK